MDRTEALNDWHFLETASTFDLLLQSQQHNRPVDYSIGRFCSTPLIKGRLEKKTSRATNRQGVRHAVFEAYR